MKSIEQIAEDIRAHGSECGFEPCMTCTQPVPGEGNPAAEIMLIGEAPGKHEDLQGRPFVGAAGKLLDELIGSIGLQREDVFIGNVLKHRPPGNRDPRPEEVEHEWPWLKQQVEAIKPVLIVLLGRHAMDRFVPGCKIFKDHGRGKRYRGQVYFPVYHPAAALYTGSLKQTLFDDFAKIPALLEKAKALPEEPAVIEPAGAPVTEPATPAEPDTDPVSREETT